jgi:hypothetical protein
METDDEAVLDFAVHGGAIGTEIQPMRDGAMDEE